MVHTSGVADAIHPHAIHPYTYIYIKKTRYFSRAFCVLSKIALKIAVST